MQNKDNNRPRRRRRPRIFTRKMQKKLIILFVILLVAFTGLGVRIYIINRDNGEEYKRQVLSQQAYDSKTIPYKRGTISDNKGTILASSTLVYNVVIDAKQILEDEKYLEPTLSAITVLGLDAEEIRDYIKQNPDSQYYVATKNLPFETKTKFDEKAAEDSNVQGVWFEDNYIRSYPNGSLASDVLGFSGADNNGSFGLEEYYNDTLNGTPGRTYGYLDESSTLERTTIDATNGDNLVLTLDANVQSIVEKYLKQFNDQYANNEHEGNGARNIGCVVMKVDTGEVLAMASYPNYDLNNPWDMSAIVGMPVLGENDQPTDEYMTAESVEELSDEDVGRYLNALWTNYCISTPYEPGSVAKPFTVAAGLESGKLTGNESYDCEGYIQYGDSEDERIYCHNRYGDGVLTISQAIERSCNVALMKMATTMGKEIFTKFQEIFNFGLKTNIDLAGETRTDNMLYSADEMGLTDLYTNSFGQNFSVTMIQGITGFVSLINGGNYYEPHMVSKITSANGATVQNIEPRILRKTISESTSQDIRDYCLQVVVGENGTGKTARPAGYLIGGKTGTAETLPRGNNQYVVSFMGYAPANDPEIAIYVVVDRPNVYPQDDAKYATGIVRNVLTEILPYLHIYMTEPLSEEERAELEKLQLSDTLALGANSNMASTASSGETAEEATTAEDASEASSGGSSEQASTAITANEIYKTFPLDPETGYAIDPNTGNLVDPETGYVFESRNTSNSTNTAAENAGTASSSQIATETPATETPAATPETSQATEAEKAPATEQTQEATPAEAPEDAALQ